MQEGELALVARPRVERWVLLLAYTLATVLSQCAHDHGLRMGPPSDHAGAVGGGDPSIVAHDEPTAAAHHDGCVACRFLSENQAAEHIEPAALFVLSEDAPLPPSATPRSGPSPRPSCRAPPLG